MRVVVKRCILGSWNEQPETWREEISRNIQKTMSRLRQKI